MSNAGFDLAGASRFQDSAMQQNADEYLRGKAAPRGATPIEDLINRIGNTLDNLETRLNDAHQRFSSCLSTMPKPETAMPGPDSSGTSDVAQRLSEFWYRIRLIDERVSGLIESCEL